MSETSLYEQMGGAPAIDRLVEAFYANMDSLPEARKIRALHAPDLSQLKADLKNYFSEWTGGPALYSPVKGHPRMRQRHMGVAIGAAERDAWMLCMTKALEETVANPEARASFHQSVEKLADWMRNKNEAQ